LDFVEGSVFGAEGRMLAFASVLENSRGICAISGVRTEKIPWRARVFVSLPKRNPNKSEHFLTKRDGFMMGLVGKMLAEVADRRGQMVDRKSG
jgi:hypothetical protein